MKVHRLAIIALVFSACILLIPEASAQWINGTQAGSGFGFSVAVGDLNGDGDDDLVVGAPNYDSGLTDRGAVFLFFGPISSDIDLGDADGSFIGEDKNDNAGWAVATGDVNGDGMDDVLVGAPGNDATTTNSGIVYVIFGWTSFPWMESLANANSSLPGKDNSDRAGYAVASDDVNGDGIDDIVLSAPFVDVSASDPDSGVVYIRFGKTGTWAKTISLYNADASYLGLSDGDLLGSNLTCGDINGDGYAEVIMTSPTRTVSKVADGEVFISFGRRSRWRNNVDVSKLNASFRGENDHDFLGWGIDAGYDVNGDGIGDLAIGSRGGTGIAYIVYGRLSGYSERENIRNADVEITGEFTGDGCGMEVALGMFNRSLSSGIIIGAPQSSNNRGSYAMVHGGSPDNYTDGDVSNGSFNSSMGWDLASGDMDGDGLMDAVASAPVANTTVFQGGSVRIESFAANTEPTLNTITLHKNLTEEPDFFLLLHDPVFINATGTGGSPDQDVAWVEVTTNSTSPGIRVPLLETGPTTGQFVGAVLSTNRTDHKLARIDGQWGDYLIVKRGGASRRGRFNIPPIISGLDVPDSNEDVFWQAEYDFIDGNGDNVSWTGGTNASWITWYLEDAIFNGTPDNTNVGTYSISILIEDPFEGNDTRSYNVTVVNEPPTIITVDDTSAPEDELYFVTYTSEDDGVGAVYQISTNATWLSFNNSNASIWGRPTNSDVGYYWVNVSVTDGNGGLDYHYFILWAVNEPLTIITADITEIDQDMVYYIDYDSTDDPKTDWYLWTDADFLTLNGTTGELYGEPDNWDVGEWDVNVSVSDRHNGTAYTNFSLKVVNLPPVLTVNTSFDIFEDDVFFEIVSYTEKGTDTTLNITFNGTWLEEGPDGFGGTPDDADIGWYWVDIEVEDKWGARDNASAIINVSNRPPVILGSPTSTIDEDSEYTFDLDSTDPVGNWTLTGPKWLKIDADGGLSGTPRNKNVGFNEFTAEVTDQNNVSGFLDFNVTVNNVKPEIFSLKEDEVNEGDIYYAQFNSSDFPVVWEVDVFGDWLDMDSDGNLFGTPLNRDVGEVWINVTCNDTHGGKAKSTFIIEVLNVAPTIISTTPSTIKEDSALSWRINSSDDPWTTWEINSTATWLTIDDEGLITGTPRNVDVGIWEDIMIMVDDGHGGSASTNFTLNVQNTPPSILNTPTLVANEGEDYKYQLISSDNGNINWIMLEGHPEWLQIDPDTGFLSGRPHNDDVMVDEYNITVKLYDGNQGEAETTFPIQVYNTAPEILTEAVVVAYEGQQVRMDLESTDDGKYESWHVWTNAQWLTYNDTSRRLSGLPSEEEIGVYTVNISVTDGWGSGDYLNFTITVHNDAPVLTFDAFPSLKEDEALLLPVRSTDPIFGWNFTTDANWLFFNHTTGRLSGTPVNRDVGVWYVNITGYDMWDQPGYLELSLAVENRPPFISPDQPSSYIAEDGIYNVDFNSTDPEQFWNVTGPDWLYITPSNGILYGTPGDADFGTHNVTVNVSDGKGGFGEVSYILYVENINDPPELTGEQVPVINATKPFVFHFTVHDPDGPEDESKLVWDLVEAPAFMKLSTQANNANLTGLPSNAEAGTYNVSLSVSDKGGLTAWNNFTLIVLYLDQSPVLHDGRVSPTGGDDKTVYHFTVWYRDPEDKPPSSIMVVIDGIGHEMHLSEGRASDGLYNYDRKLGRGKHAYYFRASDGVNTAVSTGGTPLNGTAKSFDVKAHDDLFPLLLADVILIAILIAFLILVLIYLMAPDNIKRAFDLTRLKARVKKPRQRKPPKPKRRIKPKTAKPAGPVWQETMKEPDRVRRTKRKENAKPSEKGDVDPGERSEPPDGDEAEEKASSEN